jgi:HEPN domain-containing protein
MLTGSQLRRLAKARLKDAEVLFRGNRFHGASYLCGYAVETALKARICAALRWPEYQISKDFSSFKTHDLGVLLSLSGMAVRIRTRHLGHWSIVEQWNPEKRYEPVGTVTKKDAKSMIQSTKALLAVI